MKKELFKNIIGYNDIKKTLERIIDIINNQEKYKRLGSTIPHGVFLYGPPGLGKTTFAYELLKNIENRKQYIVRKVKSDGFFINYLNDIFKKAKNNQPSIILLDDIDKFAENNNFYNKEEFVTVQSLIDDIKNDDILVIATANDKYILPHSLLRSGRFDVKIKIDYPKKEEAFKIIKHYLQNKKIENNVNVKKISYILENVSCADLEKVCNQAGLYAGFKNKNKIGMKELLRASLELAYDTNIEDDNKEDKYALNTAYHEAGHAIVGEILEPGSVLFITIAKTSSNTKGITKLHNNEYYFEDIDFMKNRLISLLAGRAATEIIYNKCDVGTNSDLDRAYTLAAKLVDNYCMLDFNSWIRDIDQQSEKVKQSKDDNITKLMNAYYNKAKEILIKNKNKLDILAHTLKNKKILFQDEIQNIIKNSNNYTIS